MKLQTIVFGLTLALTSSGAAATCDEWVSQGRASLAASNLVNANLCFSNAVSQCPAHESANVFYAVSRLLVLPGQTPLDSFLTRLGLDTTGRDLYNWTALFATNADGHWRVPAGVNASDVPALARSEVLPQVIGASGNLTVVSNTAFLLDLTTNDTALAAVSVDYGDVLLLRAMLRASEYFAYTALSVNCDIQLTNAETLLTNRTLGVQRLLADYPQLLTFSTTNDLAAAKQAFMDAVDLYVEASYFIRSRPLTVNRLFNYDPALQTDELNFRETLLDLKSSLTNPVVWRVNTNYTFSLARQFDGLQQPREFMPAFTNNAIVEGTVPDPTFGGLVGGLSGARVDKFLRNNFEMTTPNARWWMVAKTYNYVQTNSSLPGLDSAAPYGFLAVVHPSASGTVTKAELTPPGGLSRPLPAVWQWGMDYQPWATNFATNAVFSAQGDLDSAYPNGVYGISVYPTSGGTRSFTLALTNDLYPSTPHISNFDEAQALVIPKDFVLRWDPMVGGTTNDFIQVQISVPAQLFGMFDVDSPDALVPVFTTPDPWDVDALDGTSTGVKIPLDRIWPGTVYTATIRFAKVTDSDRATFPDGRGVAAYATTTSFTLGATDVRSYLVAKGQHYLQTNDMAPALKADGAFAFRASVDNMPYYTVDSLKLRKPDGSEEGTDYYAPIYHSFNSESNLDAAYPDGAYTMTFGSPFMGYHPAELDLVGDAYPSTPHLNNYDAAQHIDGTANFVLTWDAFAGGTTNDFIQIAFSPVPIPAGEEANYYYSGSPAYLQPGALNGTATNWVIPRKQLYAGRTYYAALTFGKGVSLNTNSYPGASGVAAYYKTTSFLIHADQGLPLSDLVPIDLVWSNAPVAGWPLLVFVTVTNQGAADASGWQYDFYLTAEGTIGPFDIPFDTEYAWCPKLHPGAKFKNRFAITLPSSPATNSFLVVRAASMAPEVRSDNNTLARPITLSGADLVPIALDWSGVAEPSASIDVSWVVSNLGDRTAIGEYQGGPPCCSGTFLWDAIYLSTNASLQDARWVSDSAFGGSLPPGNSYALSNSVRLPAVAPGDYYLILEANAYDGAREACTTNNLRVVPITLSAPATVPDLVPLDLATNAPAIAGQPLPITVLVTNQGTGATLSSWQYYVYLSSTPQWDSSARYVGWGRVSASIAVGASLSVNTTLDLPADLYGSQYLIVRVDSSEEIYELNKTNNLLAAPVTIMPGPPQIVRPPADVVGNRGVGFDLSVSVNGTLPFSYQWRKESVNLARASGSFLRFSSPRASDAGHYDVIVSNPFGVVTSAVATVRVNVAPADGFQGPYGTVHTLALQPDGKILAGGWVYVNGWTSLCRFNSTGAPDSSFNSGTDGTVNCLALQGDGKILVGGQFTVLGGQSCTNLGRLNEDGTLDTSFNAWADDSVNSLALQADGKILVGGWFNSLGGQSCSYLGRLNADAALDANFTSGADGGVSSIALQADGKVLVGGQFSMLSGQSCASLGRLNADGTIDATFTSGTDGQANCLALQADGRVLVGGQFTLLGGQSCTNLGRLNADGTVDTTFNSGADGSVNSIVLQADGRILVGGRFGRLSGGSCTNLGRLDSSGTLEPAFQPIADPTGEVYALGLQPDGRVLVGGAFWRLAGQYHYGLGRLVNTAPATQSLSADGTAITWLRGGTSPEVGRVSFDYSANDVSWTVLGEATRVTGGWQLTGVTLSEHPRIRARGQVSGGYQNGSGWYVQSYFGAPTIQAGPDSPTLYEHDLAYFSVVADGSAPLSYQWQKDGADIGGATGAALMLMDVALAEAGSYSVIVTNAYGSVTSPPAILTVLDRGPLTDGLVAWYSFDGDTSDQSGHGNDGWGEEATLTADRFGNPDHAYYFNGTNSCIELPLSYQLYNQRNASISYWVKYYIPSGSDEFAMPICSGSDWLCPPGFYTYATASQLTHCLGESGGVTASVSIPFDATVPLALQPFVFVTFVADSQNILVYKNGVLQGTAPQQGIGISRPNSDWFIGCSGDFDWFPYYLNGMVDDVRIYNRPLSADEVAQLYVLEGGMTNAAPVIVTQPSSATNLVGTTVGFTVQASGTEPLSYQWLKDGTALFDSGRISGTTSTNLTITSVQLADAGSYLVVVSNAFGTASATTTLEVRDIFGAYNYFLTTNYYQPQDDWAAAVRAEYGPYAEVVDWNTLKSEFGSSVEVLRLLFDYLGIAAYPFGEAPAVTWNGSQIWSGDRSYGVNRLEGNVPSGYLVHDQILNYWVSLGSWPALRRIIARLAFSPAPTFTLQPRSQTNNLGTTVLFAAVATGATPLSYQWLKDGGILSDDSRISGATSSNLVISCIQPSDSGSYSVTVTNIAGSTNSASVQLVIADVATGTVFFDSFECYAAGQAAPPPWSGDGAGDVVTGAHSSSGQQALELSGWGSCWEAIADREIPVTNALFIEFAVNPSSSHGGGCHPYTAFAGLRNTRSWTTANEGRTFVWFDRDTHRILLGGSQAEAGNWQFDRWCKVGVLYEKAATNILLTFWIDGQKWGPYSEANYPDEDSIRYLEFSSGDGTTWVDDVRVTVTNSAPRLVVTPASLAAAMVPGNQSLVSCSVMNVGTIPSGDVQVRLPAPRPDWLSLATTAVIPSLEPGASAPITLLLSPSSALPLGPYTGTIAVWSTAAGQTTVPFEFDCVSTNVGNLRVTVVDEFTYYAAGAPKVADATVTLLDPYTHSNLLSAVTGADGVALFTNVPEAYYEVSVQAAQHGGFRTVVLVPAGQTYSLTAFLARQMVSYSWIVTTNDITDRYEFTLETRFETEVPAPVVTVEPGALNLCAFTNDSFEVDFTIANHGWIAAQEAQLSFATNAHYAITPLFTNLGIIPAMSNIVVPVLIQRLATTDDAPSHLEAHLDWQLPTTDGTRYYRVPIYVYNAGLHDCEPGSFGSSPIDPGTGGGGWSGGGGVADGPAGGTPGDSPTNPIIGPPPVFVTETNDVVHVGVTVQLQQTAVLTRTAFTASLGLQNGWIDAISNVCVTLDIRDATGASAADRFGIRGPDLVGINDLCDTNALDAGAGCQVTWTLIPATNAAAVSRTDYTIGGRLTYQQDGQTVEIPLYPVPIRVFPEARLVVDYFWEQVVYSDDPFTPQVEPAVPFAVGVRMKNVGFGTARAVTVTSAQPRIVENTNGLLVDFQLIGSQVGTQAVTPSLSVVLGDIRPGECASAVWWMTASMQGLFTNFQASFQHLDDLGHGNLSLVESVAIHPLVHAVRADQPDDLIPDFLADDGSNSNGLPDHLYLSGCTEAPVAASTNGALQDFGTNALLTFTPPPGLGWVYLRVPYPDSFPPPAAVRRSDGPALMMGSNVWLTHRHFHPDTGAFYTEHALHILDFNSTGSYTLDYGLTPGSSVNPLPAVVYTTNFLVSWSGTNTSGGSDGLSYDIYVSEDGGAYQPWLADTAVTSAWFLGQFGHSYGFYSIARDNFGNVEPLAASPLDAFAQVLQDVTLPVVAITSGPADNAIVTNSALQFGGVATDDVALGRVEWCLQVTDGTCLWQSADGTTNWQADVSNLVVGRNTFRVRARDWTDNLSTEASRSIVLDLAGPTVGITNPAPNAPETNSAVEFSGWAADDVGVAAVEWQLRNASFTTPWEATASTTNWSVTVSNLVYGTNILAVRARDVAGRFSSEATSSVILLAPLTVSVSGWGWITPTNDLGVTYKEVGADYTLTAHLYYGFAFTNWTGSLTATTATLTFTMQPGLVLQANFVPVDTNRAPWLSIISHTNLQLVFGTNTMLAGIAYDYRHGDHGITNVAVNGKPAAGGSATVTNIAYWSNSVALVSGTNTFTVVAKDGDGYRRTSIINLIRDITRPTFAITAPKANQYWSNAVFTATGTARDSVWVSNVWCQLNSNGWFRASGTTNWMAPLDLTLRTNWLQAYAEDGSGNRSVTGSVRFVYIRSDRLNLSITGMGTLSPNYSNAMLEIGKTYTITAKPGVGCVFSNWTGGVFPAMAVLTNKPTLRFVMQSNLVLQANFLDAKRPALVIKSPAPNQPCSNAVWMGSGTAQDNVRVSNVWYQLNSNGWFQASGTTNWTARLDLTLRTNRLQAYAEDASGNRSAVGNATFYYIRSDRLNLSITGKGTVSPNLSNAMVEIGTINTITAKPAVGFVFSNWVGGVYPDIHVLTNKPTLRFLMQSNLVLQANFLDTNSPAVVIESPVPNEQCSNAVFTITGTASDNVAVRQVWYNLNGAGWQPADGTTNWSKQVALVKGTNTLQAYAEDITGNRSVTNKVPFVYNQFLALAGTYNGLFSPGTGLGVTNCGTFALTLGTNRGGGFSGKLSLQGTNLPFAGSFSSNLQAFVNVSRGVKPPLVMALQINPLWQFSATQFSSNVMTGTVTDGSDWVSDLVAFRAFSSKASAYAGNYTLLIRGSDDAAASPPGDSGGAVAVSGAGTVTVKGSLADRTSFACSAALSVDGHWAMFTPLYGGRGLFMGWAACDTNQPGVLSTNFWLKPALVSTNPIYANGFAAWPPVLLSKYAPTRAGHSSVNWTNGRVVLEFGNLPQPLTNYVVVNNNVVRVVGGTISNLLFGITNKDGTFGGSFKYLGTNKFSGVPVPAADGSDAYGGGFFVGASEGGWVRFESAESDWAPSTLEGKTFQILQPGQDPIRQSFGARTFSTHDGDHGMGAYTWEKLGPDNGRLVLTYRVPPHVTGISMVVELAFTSANSGSATTYSNGVPQSVGAFSALAQLATAPVSLAGEAPTVTVSQGQNVTWKLSSMGTFTQTQPTSGTAGGSWTYTRYSAIGGLLWLKFTRPSLMTNWVECTFETPKQGTYVDTLYAPGQQPQEGAGPFTLSP